MIAQEVAAESFQDWGDLNAWNPLALSRNFQTLEKRTREKGSAQKLEEENVEEKEELIPLEKIQNIAEDYEKKNPELRARFLLALRARISKEDQVESILKKVKDTFFDLYLRDEALNFLLQATKGMQYNTIQRAKEELSRLYEREIRGGRNIEKEAREFSTKGLGSPTALRELYRHVTSTSRSAYTLFQELSQKFPFEKMKSVLSFMLHSLGTDMKSKGPSISRGELQLLLNETRDMQAILGVYRFFASRMPLMVRSFQKQGKVIPPSVNFERLSQLLMEFLQEKYPSVVKALLIAKQLGMGNDPLAQWVVYLQYRDALRQIAPRLFRNEKHRQELLLCFIETLEELEEEEEKKKEKEHE